MDTFLFYRLIRAVEESIAAAGFGGFRLARAEDAFRWFDAGRLFDFVAGLEHREIPLRWEGLELRTFDTLAVNRRGADAWVHRSEGDGIAVVRGEVCVAVLHLTGQDAYEVTHVIVGERREGALQEFLREYDAHVRCISRDCAFISVIEGDDIPRPRGLDWEDLVAPPLLRAEARLQVEGFFSARAAYGAMGIPYRRGLLLAGPPGNGKTTFLRIVSCLRPEPMILFGTKGQKSRDSLDEAFDRATALAPCILCFEDVDTIFDGDITLSYFLNRLDGLAPMEGVLLMATTNHPEKLDEALVERPSRFDRIFVFDNPGPDERRAYLRRCFGPAFDARLVEATDGLSVAHLKEVWVTACLEAIHGGDDAPRLDGALRAVRRLKGQKDDRVREWKLGGLIGFRSNRAGSESDRNSNRRDNMPPPGPGPTVNQ